MNNQDKTEERLLAELKEAREQIQELEKHNREYAQKTESLREERDRLCSMIDHLPDCHVFLKDRQSRFVITNQYLVQLLGKKTMEDVIGKTDFDFFPKELAEQYFKDEQEVMRSGKPVLNREEKTVDTGGHEYWLLTTKVPLYSPKGDIVGVAGVSTTAPQSPSIAGVVGVSRDITPIKTLEKERELLIQKLQEALGKIKTLHGLIPICASCKKIRDDSGYWQQVEVYVRDHSDADFSHGYCPDCAKRYMAEFHRDKDQKDRMKDGG